MRLGRSLLVNIYKYSDKRIFLCHCLSNLGLLIHVCRMSLHSNWWNYYNRIVKILRACTYHKNNILSLLFTSDNFEAGLEIFIGYWEYQNNWISNIFYDVIRLNNPSVEETPQTYTWQFLPSKIWNHVCKCSLIKRKVVENFPNIFPQEHPNYFCSENQFLRK